ncbi:Uncharacterised protein [Mycobacteroides abscessus subsp. abscessus]|nr:Uncharacterised protein [Mycobacteroides abscessus subsp. abscessus]
MESAISLNDAPSTAASFSPRMTTRSSRSPSARRSAAAAVWEMGRITERVTHQTIVATKTSRIAKPTVMTNWM